ncbi:MAG: hypothetical protein NC123_16410 [Butyrivibrio sp.]|nr:hypothetical protein [Acetatifactor muris]MCM1561102.1 hypothetical protein [Butyrivibrio sp.]
MTREQIEQEYRVLLKEWNDEEDDIMKKAKESGTWKPGLDSNRELFAGITEKYWKRIQELRDSLDE